MEDTQMIDCLMQALDNYLEAKKRRDTCYEQCDYSAGYFCAGADNDVADAAKEFKEFLTKVVLEIVAEDKLDKEVKGQWVDNKETNGG